MTVFKSSNISVEIKNGRVDIGDVGVKFYTQDINTTLLNIRVLKDEQFLNFNDEQYKPFINLFMGDGSVFLDQPVEISDAENGLLTYKLADKVKHAGWVKFKLILKKEDESLHAANFKLEILDSGLESEIGRVIDVDILMNAFERFALKYPEKIRGKAFTYEDFTEEQLALLKGPKGDDGPKGEPGEDGKSAYEVAVENGFKGSEKEFIESLKNEFEPKESVNTKSALPLEAVKNEIRGVIDENSVYIFNGKEWVKLSNINLNILTDIQKVFRYTKGTVGSEEAINTIIGYKDNAIADGIRGAHVQQGSKGNENIIGGDPSTIGTATPNKLDPTKNGAHYAFVGGYDNVNNALAGTLMGYHCYVSDLATHGAIYGGSYHKILDGDYAFMAGGTKNLIQNSEGGNYGYILAGNNNKYYGRFGGILSGMNNRIGTELSNKDYSGIYNSYASTIDGNYAAVLNGNNCKATKDYSFARGNQAVANNVGESVFSTGKFKTVGDSGQSSMHLLRQTTNHIETQLLLDDSGSAIITPVGVNTTLVVSGTVSAHRIDAEGFAGFSFTAVLGRATGSLQVLSSDIKTLYSSDPAYSVAIKTISSNSAYQILVQGVAGHTVNWTAKLDCVWSRNI